MSEGLNLGQKFKEWKKAEGFEGAGSLGGALEGLWYLEKKRDIEAFEKKFPGIRAEFDRLINMLPDPDSSNKTEFPFAASVARVHDDKEIEIIARSLNRVNKTGKSTQHAEIAAMEDAMEITGDKHLRSCILLSTAQPCMMCTGAITNAEVSTVVYSITQKEMEGKHVKFDGGFKPIRTTPTDFEPDKQLQESGIEVYGGYKRAEVMDAISRSPSTFSAFYSDPDTKL